MAQVPDDVKSGMGIVFAEADMAEVFAMLRGRVNVVMNLITGPEIICDAITPLDYQSFMKDAAASLTRLIRLGGLFFGHASAPQSYLSCGWDMKTPGEGAFFFTRT